jgi:hypothetical protein
MRAANDVGSHHPVLRSGDVQYWHDRPPWVGSMKVKELATAPCVRAV